MVRLILILYLFAGLTGLCANAQILWGETGVPVVVSDNLQYSGGTAQLEDGSTIVVWSKNANGERVIYAMRYDSSGQEMWAFPHNVYESDAYPFYVKVKLLSDGNLMLYWVEEEYYEDSSTRMLRITDEGDPLWEQPLTFEGSWEYYAYNCIPDNAGGVYLESQFEYTPVTCSHISDDGILDWEIEMFEGNNVFLYRFPSCPDGDGGIISAKKVCVYDPMSYYVAVQRITLDGDTPWGDNGYVGFTYNSVITYPDIVQTGENEFTVVWLNTYDTPSIDVRRIDCDGLTLSEATLPLDVGINANEIRARAISDDSGNIFFAWSEEYNTENNAYIAKIDPDNQLEWLFSAGSSFDSVVDMEIALDDEFNLNLLWLNSYHDLMMQKIDTDGVVQWNSSGILIAEDVGYYYDQSLVSIENAMLVFWMENIDLEERVCKQKVGCEGVPEWEGDDLEIVRGNKYFASSLCFSECNDSSDRLAYSWRNSDCLFQTIDFNGEYSAPDPCPIITSEYSGQNSIMSIERIDEDYVIVWDHHLSSIYELCVNRFDVEGNRVWDEDIVLCQTNIYTENPPQRVRVETGSGDPLIYWSQSYVTDNKIKMQKIIDGQIAWPEPKLVYHSLTSGILLVDVVDDYVIWWDLSSQVLCVMRVTLNGEPYEGWADNGLQVLSYENLWTDPLYQKNEQGLVVVWPEEINGEVTLYLQIVNSDGTLYWETAIELMEQESPSNLQYVVSGNVVYALWQEWDEYHSLPEVFAEAVNLNGEALWDSESSLIDNFGTLCDAVQTPDGCMFVGYHRYDDGRRCDILMQHVNSERIVWDETMTVCGLAGNQVDPEIHRAADNKYFVTWEDTRNLAFTAGEDIFAQLIQYEPVAIDDPTAIPTWDPNLSTYPNPFNPETTVQFSLQKETKVALKVYNVKGQLVRTLCDEVLPLGEHHIEWDGRDNVDRKVSSGVYLINLNVNGRDYRSKALLLK